MKNRPLAVYLIIITLLSAGFILLMKGMGAAGNYLAALYMLCPAIAALFTRLVCTIKFKDVHFRIGRLKHYILYWAAAAGTTALSFTIFTLFGAIRWDFTGGVFLDQLANQFELAGQSINDLPSGLTPKMMLIIYFIGGLTIFNILPGIITGLGEEFGWRGLMFPQLYKIKPWAGFIVGGLIWFLWHLPLSLVLPQSQNFTVWQTILNTAVLAVGSICTHSFLAYIYIKTENVLVTSVAHITLDNTARSFSYFSVVQDQIMANIGLAVTMLIVVAILYCSKEWKVFKDYFSQEKLS